MNRYILLLGFCYAISALLASPVVLPDLEIGGTASIKSFVYKKEMSPSFSDSLAQSMPQFYPRLMPKSPTFDKNTISRGHFALEANTASTVRSELSIRPESGIFEYMKHRLSYQNDYSYRSHFKTNLSYTFSPNHAQNLIAEADLSHFEYREIDTSNLHTRLFYSAHDKSFRTVTIGNQNLVFGVDYLKQSGIIDSQNKVSPHFSYSNTLFGSSFNLANKIILSQNHPALMTELDIPTLNAFTPPNSAALVLIADGKRVLPSLRFEYALIRELNQSLIFKNRPALAATSAEDVFQNLQWLLHPKEIQVSKTPLNFGIEYALRPVWERIECSNLFRFSNTTTVTYDTPILTDSGTALPTYRFVDSVSNISSTSMETIIDKNTRLVNSVAWDFTRILDEDLTRIPYKPNLRTSTELILSLSPIEYALILDQYYNTIDHWGKHLKDVIDLSIRTEYQLRPQQAIQLEINNLFNYRTYDFAGMPSRGLNLSIGYSQFF